MKQASYGKGNIVWSRLHVEPEIINVTKAESRVVIAQASRMRKWRGEGQSLKIYIVPRANNTVSST